MGERMTGSHEVVGSIPISSTNDDKGLAASVNPFLVESSRLGADRVQLGAVSESSWSTSDLPDPGTQW